MITFIGLVGCQAHTGAETKRSRVRSFFIKIFSHAETRCSKKPCCDFNKSTRQSRVAWRKITESNCHRCQWTGFQVQLASKASIFQNCGAGRENRTLTLSLARTQATITSYPQKLGGNGEIRTLGTHYCVRQVSNLLPSTTRPRFLVVIVII